MFVATVVPCRRLSTSASATPAFAHSAADALDDAARRVVRGRRDLVDRDPARLLVDEDQVGERAADVDADPLHRSHLLRAAGMIVCGRPAPSARSSRSGTRTRPRRPPARPALRSSPGTAPPGRRSRSRRRARPSDSSCAPPTSRGGRRSSRSRRALRRAGSSPPACRAPGCASCVSAMWFAHAAGAQRHSSHASSWSSPTRIAQSAEISTSSGSRPASSAPARTWSIAQRTDAGWTPT